MVPYYLKKANCESNWDGREGEADEIVIFLLKFYYFIIEANKLLLTYRFFNLSIY
jgi:hypothetical protein